MDPNDSFSEGLLQKVKVRRNFINEQKTDVLSTGKKRAALVEDYQKNSDVPPEESPKRQCTGIVQTTYSTHNKENIEMQDDETSDFIPYHLATKAKGLAALKKKYSNDEDDDSKASDQQETPTSVNTKKTNTGQISPERKQNLILAPEISKDDHSDDDESIDEDDFAENYNDIKSDDGNNNMEIDFSPSKLLKNQEKLNEPRKFEIFEKPKSPVLQKNINMNVDPAELPLSARKALFENALLNGTLKVNDDVVDHKLSVAQRAAMFENASKNNSGAKNVNFKEPKRIALSNFEKFEKRSFDVHKSPIKSIQSATNINFQEMKASPVKKMTPETVTSTPSPTKSVGNHTRFIQQKLMESSGSNWQEKQVAKAADERKQEIFNLVNHWEKLSSSSSVENNSDLERVHLASEEKASSESDVVHETTGSEEDEPHNSNDEEYCNEDNTKNDSMKDESDYTDNDEPKDDISSVESIHSSHVFYDQEDQKAKAVNLKNTEENPNENSCAVSSYASSVTSSSYSGMSSVADDSNYHASNSQSCSSGSSVRSYDLKHSKTEDVFHVASVRKESKNPEINLLRTVSAYRREKQETKLTPVRTVVRREKVSSPESPPDDDFTEVIQQRLKELQEEILRQQIVISQTSQALNLCSASAEFSGSTEQVEGERLLLIATQKRQACLNEMTRLKTCGAQGENLVDGTGTLTISDLQLPLKREFIASQLEGRGNDTVHYFLCLIRHGAQVIVTQMMSTDDKGSDGILSFTNHIQLRNLPADFSVVFEVYALQTKKEVLPHEKKYHIKRENSRKRLTPKGKKLDGKILLPAVSSPGGPSAVRSPSFGVVGFSRFTLQNCNKKTFTLDKVPFASPLEGVLRVQIQLHAEHKVILKGFLTFYEDVGNTGALYRRWCVLDGDHIAYWLYPDDEQKREPLGSIDLRQCVTGLVKSVSTLECARSHTFKLVTIRPQKKGDKDTLISRTVNTLTTTKHLLTADTKEERILWCNKINEALTNVRKWDPEALRPIETINI